MTPSLHDRLARGRPLVGTWCITASPALVEAAAIAGVDFVILDAEHGVFGADALESCIRAASVGGAAALVRVPATGSTLVQVALDLGADGIVFPQVRDADDVRRGIAATRFPPDGGRGFNPFTRAGGYGMDDTPLAERPPPFTMAIIENRAAFGALSEIVDVAGLDAVYIGVYDMSVELGTPGQIDGPEVESFTRTVLDAAHGAGLAVGAMTARIDGLAALDTLGVDLVVFGVDTGVYGQSIAAAVATCRNREAHP